MTKRIAGSILLGLALLFAAAVVLVDVHKKETAPPTLRVECIDGREAIVHRNGYGHIMHVSATGKECTR